MVNPNDDRLAEAVLKLGKATREQIADARDLAGKMRALGVETDVLSALVERHVLSREEAEALCTLAAGTPQGQHEAPPAAAGPLAPDAPSLGSGVDAPAVAPPAGPAAPALGAPPSPRQEAGDGRVKDVGSVEETESAVEEAEAIEEAEAVEAAEAPAPAAPVTTAPAAGVTAGAAPSPQEQPVATALPDRRMCYNHPGMPALFSCVVCGRGICAACVVRTPKGDVCSSDCLTNLETRGAMGLPRDLVRSVVKIAMAAVVVLGVVVAVVVMRRPSEELVAARRLADRVKEVEEAGDPNEALKAARSLASMTAEEEEVMTLAKWGRDRVEVLESKIGLSALDELRKSVTALGDKEVDALLKERAKVDALAGRFPDAKDVRKAAVDLRALIDERRQAAREAHEKEELAAAEKATLDAVADLKAAVEPMLESKRFAEAGLALARARKDAGESPHRVILDALRTLDRRLDELARKGYEEEDRAAQALIAEKKHAEARRVYQRVVDTYA